MFFSYPWSFVPRNFHETFTIICYKKSFFKIWFEICVKNTICFDLFIFRIKHFRKLKVKKIGSKIPQGRHGAMPTEGPKGQRAQGPKGQRAKGPKGPTSPRAQGPKGQRAKKPRAKGPNSPRAQRPKGQRAKGPRAKGPKGPTNAKGSKTPKTLVCFALI